MPSFLVNRENTCCCPEMRCCPPENVQATLNGWSGSTHFGFHVPPGSMNPCSQWYGVPYFGSGSYCEDYFDCGAAIGECIQMLTVESEPTEENPCYTYAGPGVCLYDGELWSGICFPPTSCVEMSFCGYSDYAFVLYGYLADQALCNSPETAKLCSTPPTDPWHYGPFFITQTTTSQTAIYDEDFNGGTYVCHRATAPLRPELKATINRSIPFGQQNLYGITNAKLMFEVRCRRNIATAPCGYDITGFDCNPFPPPGAGEEAEPGHFHCVDYRCNRLHDNFVPCERNKCMAAGGYAEPHLYAYHDDGNQSAVLKLRKVPAQHVSTDNWKDRFAFSWKIGSVDIFSGGQGYSVGEFFEVDYDTNWLFLGGEVIFGFPEVDDSRCGLPIEWQDKYGKEQDIDNGILPIQRLRVSEVDEDGAITKLEIVPWFKDPEYKPDCIDTVPNHLRTPYYVEYTRVLCHPTSVEIAGKGYNIGDTIEFYCDDPACETFTPATASVSDIDDEGGILDWFISGSDIEYSYGFPNPAEYERCTAYGQPDNRGAYKWDGKHLCDLAWSGVGVPVRAMSRGIGENARNISFPERGTSCGGGLTILNLSIGRAACETSIEVYCTQYIFDSNSFLDLASNPESPEYVISLFKPYPKCRAGGSIIEPTFGAAGVNESQIGSSLTGGIVRAKGKFHAFKDKRHVAPTLPLQVPAIDAGFGAVIASFAFSSVNDFPGVNYADGYPHEPAADRFSYFPVTSATIDSGARGSGYEVGQEFDVYPAGGKAFSNPWSKTGGDDPDDCPNGAWYSGAFAKVDGDGRFLRSGTARYSLCRLRIAGVNEDGGITSLEVVHGGMMFKTEFSVGVKHPELIVYIMSSPGYGAFATFSVDTNLESDSFGGVTGITMVTKPAEVFSDPLHPGQAMPLGGRDYGDQGGGYYWELRDVTVGGPVYGAHTLLGHIDWHNFILNPFHNELDQYDIIEGSRPPFVPKSAVCAFGDCYHSLLNREYALFRLWSGDPAMSALLSDPDYRCAFGMRSASPLPRSGVFFQGRPTAPTSYGLYRLKGRSENFVDEDCNFYDPPPTPPPAEGDEYRVMEWGMTMTLSSTPNCADHSDGRTSE